MAFYEFGSWPNATLKLSLAVCGRMGSARLSAWLKVPRANSFPSVPPRPSQKITTAICKRAPTSTIRTTHIQRARCVLHAPPPFGPANARGAEPKSLSRALSAAGCGRRATCQRRSESSGLPPHAAGPIPGPAGASRHGKPDRRCHAAFLPTVRGTNKHAKA